MNLLVLSLFVLVAWAVGVIAGASLMRRPERSGRDPRRAELHEGKYDGLIIETAGEMPPEIWFGATELQVLNGTVYSCRPTPDSFYMLDETRYQHMLLTDPTPPHRQ